MENASGANVGRPLRAASCLSLSSRSRSSLSSYSDDRLANRRVSFSPSDNVDFVYSSTTYRRGGYLQTRRSSVTTGTMAHIADADASYFYCDDAEAREAARAKKLHQSRVIAQAYVKGGC